MTPGLRPAVFLDRDGVLVGTDVVDGVPTPAADPRVLPGVADACARLRAAGLVLVVVTNQPDIARGRIAAPVVDAQHAELQRVLGLDAVRMCPHDDDDRCRKPEPGMLLDAAAEARLDLRRSAMVGDRWRDVEAGRRAGVRTVLVGDGYGEPRLARADLEVDDLASAVPDLLRLASRADG